MLRKLISHLVVISFLIQLSLGLMASITSIDDENLVAMERFFKGTIPAHSHFKSQKDSTAAGGMVISEYNGKLYTLLGKRDDTGTWCNFGGKTEEGQVYLSQTGAQELMEESCGLYACPSSVLNQNPSHTLQMENITYRMYMRNFRYLKSAHFKERMGQATKGSSREYTDFAWVELDSLLSEKPVLHPDEGDSGFQEPFELFEEFNSMLQESSVRGFLSNWRKKKPDVLHTFRRFEGPNEPSAPTRITWAPVQGMHDKALEPSETAFAVPYGQNAVGATMTHKTYHKADSSLTLPVQLDPKIERETFTYSVVKKARTLMELKTKHGAKEEATPDTVPDAWKPLVEEFRKESPTERHLKWVLKDKFVEGRTNEAYEANIRTYLDELNQQKRMETRGNIPITNEIVNKLVTLLHQEVEALQSLTDPRFPLYHGASGEFGKLYLFQSLLREILQVDPLVGQNFAKPEFTGTSMHPTLLNGVRGTDMYYKKLIAALQKLENQGLTAAQVFYKDFPRDDYDRLMKAARICTNSALTSGPGMGSSTSNTIEYWLKGHSVSPVSIKKVFDEMLALLGIGAEFSFFDSIFTQYHGIPSEGDLDGSMVQMFVTPEFLGNYTHAAHIHVAPTSSQSPAIAFADPILEHKFLLHQHSNLLALTEDKIQYYPEVWAYPTPTRESDSMRFLSYQAHDLDKKGLDHRNRDLSDTWDHIVTEWLLSNTRLQEGAIYGGDPLLHRLHRMASRLHAGDMIEEKSPENALRHLILLDISEGVEMLLQEDPKQVETLSEKERRQFLVQSLASGQEKMAKILSRGFYQTEDYASQLTSEEAHIIMLTTLERPADFEDFNIPILRALNNRFDFKTWDRSYQKSWKINLGGVHKNHFPFIVELFEILGGSAIKEFLRDPIYWMPPFLEQHPSLVKEVNINQHFGEWVEDLNLLPSLPFLDNRSTLASLLEVLGIDWGYVHKGRPLIAYFFNIRSSHYAMNDIPEWRTPESYELLEKHPHLLHSRDSEGRNLRQMAELMVLDGSLNNVSLMHYLSESKLDPLSLEADYLHSALLSMSRESRASFAAYLRLNSIYDRKFRDFTSMKFSHDSQEGREAYRRDSEDIDNVDLVKALRKKVLEFKERLYERRNEGYTQPWDFDCFPKALDQKDRDTLEQEVEETKKQFVDVCKRDDLVEFSHLLTPRWRHLALSLLGTAVQYEAPQITARMLNEFFYLIPIP